MPPNEEHVSYTILGPQATYYYPGAEMHPHLETESLWTWPRNVFTEISFAAHLVDDIHTEITFDMAQYLDWPVIITKKAVEGEYVITKWTMAATEPFLEPLPFPPHIIMVYHSAVCDADTYRFIILHDPKFDISASASDYECTLTLAVYSSHTKSVHIDWGDGHSMSTDIKEAYTHTYKKAGVYTIVVKIVNDADRSTSKRVQVHVMIVPIAEASDAMYLLGADDGQIIKMMDFTTWRATWVASRCTITISTPDFTPRRGMFLCMGITSIPCVFLVEGIDTTDLTTLTITGTDLITAAASRRICQVGTATEGGVDEYNGIGGSVIPEILTKNFDALEGREFTRVVPPGHTGIGRECHVHARFGTVKKLYEQAVKDSGLVIHTEVNDVPDGVMVHAVMLEPRDTDILLSTDTGCGKLKKYSEKPQVTTCYAAGKANLEGIRPGAWYTTTQDPDFDRYEVFEDASSTEDTAEIQTAAQTRVESEEHISVVYEIWPTCPYKIAPESHGGQLWLGDSCYVDCGPFGKIKLKISKIDIAMSAKNGLTRILTFGDVVEPVERTVHTIQTSGLPNMD